MSYLNIPTELRGEKAWVNVWDGSKVPMQATVRKPANKKSSPKQDLSEEKFTGSR